MAVYSIIQKSQLEGAKRLDAEYYQPEYLEFSKISSKIGVKISDVVEFIKHPAEIERIYQNDGCPFLLTQNINKDNFILEFEAKRFISKNKANKILQNKLKKGDVVMTRTGANYGDSSLYFGEPKDLLASAHILIIRPKSVSGEYLAAYLNSKIGRSLVKRGIYGGLQPEITPDYINSICVPSINKNQEKIFIDIVNNAFLELKNSKSLYSQAENLLLEELKISEKDFNNQLSCIVNLSEAKTAKRFDAEYFEPKYKEMESRIKNHESRKLGDIVSIKKGIEPGAESYREEGKQFIRVSSLSKYEISDSEQKYLSEELYNKLKADYQPQRGEILLTKDASPGIAYVVKEDIEGIISSGILRLKLNPSTGSTSSPQASSGQEIEGEYLALCLNSIIGKMQVERDAGGSVIMHWKPEEIKNVIIPILPKPIQQRISLLVRQSFESRIKAKQLLEEAKRKVEEMIEKN